MSIFGNLNLDGAASRKDLRRYKTLADGNLSQGLGGYRTSYETAQGRYAPYAESGQRANTMYGNALGLNGRDAQAGFYRDWQDDPGHQFNVDRSTQAVQRRMNAAGFGGSGAAALGSARAAQEMEQDQYRYRMGLLGGMQGQGLQVAGQLANLDTGMGNAELGVAGKRADLDTQLGSAIAGTRSMGMQNALGLAGLGVAAFTPGAAGMSAAGSFGQGMGRMFGSGANSMFGGGGGGQYMGGSGPAYGSFRAAQGY